MKRRALVWLIMNLCMAGLLINRAHQGLRIESDILKLLPRTEQNPVAEHAVKAFSEIMGNRVLILIGHHEAPLASAAAAAFSQSLRQSSLFTAVNDRMSTDEGRGFYELYFPYRAALLSTDTMQTWSSAAGVEHQLNAAMQMLYSPLGSSLSPLLADDPLLLFPAWIKSRPEAPGTSELVDGFIQVRDGPTTYVLVEAKLRHSPFDRANQGPAIEAIRLAMADLEESTPGIDVVKTGVLFFAHAGAESAEGEIKVIGTGSMLGVVLLILLTFRSVRRLWLSLLPLLSGFLFALTISLYVFPDLHLITLGFGASLIGVCIDYAFHFFADSVGESGVVDGRRVLRTILPGITLGLITSVLAYMGLFVAPFPGLRQMAVFSAVGLIAAYVSVVAWFPLMLHGQRNAAATQGLQRVGQRLLRGWQGIVHNRLATAGVWLIGVYLAAGVFALHPNDDVRQLQSPSTELLAEEQRCRAMMGNIDLSRFMLVEGPTPEAVLQREEQLILSLRKLRDDGALDFYQGISQWVPSQAHQRASREALQQSLTTHAAAYGAYVEALAFPPDTLSNLTAQIQATPVDLTPDIWLAHASSAPLRHLWLGAIDGRFASFVLLGGVRDQSAITELEQPDGITFVNKVDDVTELFRRYRVLAAWLIVGAYGVIAAFLGWRYGARKSMRVFLPPSLAALLTMGILGHLGQPITLFNELALLLVLGIGIDYTIFFAEARSNRGTIMLAILLSAFTTLLSFGLLALSQTQALSRFGLTVLIGITLALLLAPIAAEPQPEQPHTP
ncbi:MAG: MMPL family transporter [Verrucomicrobia bacterium]|nr:MMPL family transporter [Verrucomicrobiota bacterium]